MGFPAGPQSSPVPARIPPVANQAPHKTEGLPRRLLPSINRDLCQQGKTNVTLRWLPTVDTRSKNTIVKWKHDNSKSGNTRVARVESTELYYITGGPARDQKVSPKTWRILRHFHDNTYFIFMVTATDQPRS